MLAALTVVGLACDEPRATTGIRPPVQRRAFPETADLPADSFPAVEGHVVVAEKSATGTEALPRGVARTSVAADDKPVPTKPPMVAAVLLMFPEPAADGPRGPRTYSVSLGAGLGQATVEVDGQDLGAIPVRRVYPQPRGAAPARPRFVPDVAAQPANGPGPAPTARTQVGTGVASSVRERTSNANGAPIID